MNSQPEKMNEKIRLCFLADSNSIHTVKWLRFFTGREYEVHVISFSNVEVPGCILHFLDAGSTNPEGSNIKKLFFRKKVRQLIKKINPHLVHAHYATSYGLLGALSGRKPLLITGHGTDVLITPFRGWPYKVMFKYTYRKCDIFYIVAAHMEKTFKALHLPLNKLKLVNNGIDLNVFHDAGRHERSRQVTLVCTRNLEKVYNHLYLLALLKRVVDRGLDVKLTLIGEGSLQSILLKYVSENGLENHTVFRGKLSQAELATSLQENSFYITMSLSDGSSVSLIEAMSCGCVPLASDIEANRNWIQHGHNGFLLPLDDEKAAADMLYDALSIDAATCKAITDSNNKLIQEQANFEKNMSVVESDYKKLIKQPQL